MSTTIKRRRSIRTSEEMFPVVSGFLKSGLSQRAFCKQEGIPVSIFQYWLKKYRNQGEQIESPHFHEITITPETPSSVPGNRNIIIRTHSGIVIEIPVG